MALGEGRSPTLLNSLVSPRPLLDLEGVASGVRVRSVVVRGSLLVLVDRSSRDELGRLVVDVLSLGRLGAEVWDAFVS